MTSTYIKKTKRNELHQPAAPAPAGALLLRRIWAVRAGGAYANRRPGGMTDDSLILLRTLAGAGEVELAGGRRLSCGAGTLALFAGSKVRYYGCREPDWRFWWCECEPGSTPLFAPGGVFRIPVAPGEAGELDECAGLLRGGRGTAAEASARLLLLCHRWRRTSTDRAGRRCGPAAAERLAPVLRLMPETAARPLPVPRLAAGLHVGAHRFRLLFRQGLGCTPKAHYENLRLARAAEWLQGGAPAKLAEIAADLGYSSAFHFSRAFSRRFGVPPARFRSG